VRTISADLDKLYGWLSITSIAHGIDLDSRSVSKYESLLRKKFKLNMPHPTQALSLGSPRSFVQAKESIQKSGLSEYLRPGQISDFFYERMYDSNLYLEGGHERAIDPDDVEIDFGSIDDYW